jgi:hypothetical protein
MEDFVLYNPKLRVYKDGHIEKYIKRQLDKEGIKRTINNWVIIEYTPDANGYIKIVVDKKQTYVHRLVAECFLGLDPTQGWNAMIDHIDRNPSNNNVENLRIVNNQENQWNTESRGYYYQKSKNKYHATIRYNNEHIFLGLFNTSEEAHQAYLDAKLKYHIIKT